MRNQTYSSYFIHTDVACNCVRMVDLSDLSTLSPAILFMTVCGPIHLEGNRRTLDHQGGIATAGSHRYIAVAISPDCAWVVPLACAFCHRPKI